jgi:integrase
VRQPNKEETMSPASPKIYWRDRGGTRRAYADLREFADVGGRREALAAPGEKVATSDPTIAQVLLARRLEQLTAARQGRVIHRVRKPATLESFAKDHLIAKATEVDSRTGEPLTEAWLALAEQQLQRAVDHFGAERKLQEIDVQGVREWAAALGRRGLRGGTIRHHLNTLSNLYRRAQAEGYVQPGFNPVALLSNKPRPHRAEAKWLEVPDAALILEGARTYNPRVVGGPRPFTFAYELLATFLLTGGRESEVLGLEVSDVSLDRELVTFRPNTWRRLKTSASHRAVPLWPQLREILERYLAERPPSRLLFPSFRTGDEAMVTDFHKLLDAVAIRAGWTAGEIRSKMFRHTYCAARLQTLDQGAPVSIYTVAREMGHGSMAMVERVYSHLGTIRHRAAAVEFRVEQHTAKLGERLAALRSGDSGTTLDTINGTAGIDSQLDSGTTFGTTIGTTGIDSQLGAVSRCAVSPRA